MAAIAAPAGLVTHNAVQDGAGSSPVAIDLDIREHAFLQDHLVDGRPLLSTVMGIESMACAVALTRPGRPIAEVTDVRVLDPYRLPPDGPGRGRVEVTVQRAMVMTDGLRCELASLDHQTERSVRHYTATFPGARQSLSRSRFRTVPGTSPNGRSVDADTIYRLFFHGPSFRVVRLAYHADDLMVGVLQPDLPPAVRPRRRSILAPLLIELCLQTAGLWELAVLGRMMIPESIETITRFTDVDSDDGLPLLALVSPHGWPDGPVSFDAQVVDWDGAVHLEVRGYRTTDFGHPVDTEAAVAIRRALAGIPGPT